MFQKVRKTFPMRASPIEGPEDQWRMQALRGQDPLNTVSPGGTFVPEVSLVR
jgi:hypothetical protein